MHAARWYATATTLPNGEIYIQGGQGPGAGASSDRPEIRGATGNFRAAGRRRHLQSLLVVSA